ncbi:peptidoglycan-binding protein [Roseibium sp. Sym1]|uniref:peptidoglycan-binding protein n=1 Tax=Roseibium sp. Sym1 TaxID=3016006 RepID=UPI0022B2D8BA|nr:peptidoglycan-binding protein [Roseibium sp. Sym1]
MRRILVTLSCLLPLALGAAGAAFPQSTAETVFWDSIRNSSDPADLKAYLRAYPEGRWAPLAQTRLDELDRPAAGGGEGPVTACDLWTSHPADARKVSAGVEFDWIDADRAIRACEEAVARYPGVLRFRFQLGRAKVRAKQEDEGNRLIRSAADDGYPVAMLLVGFNNRFGQTVPQNTTEALRWFEKAADAGNPMAATVLGTLYLEDREIPRNLGKALHWHLKAANAGEAQAMYNLGFMYLNGDGVSRDTAKGIAWLRKSAENGYANAALELADMYENGRHVRKDLREALDWYLGAADGGAPFASYRLSDLFRQGAGISRDDRAAAEFLFQAIEDGYVIMPEQLAADARGWSIAFRRALQEALKREGFYEGAIDGSFGPQTRQAIQALYDAGFADTGRDLPGDTDNRPMQVNIPELNVFSRPSVTANRLGSLVSGDPVTARRWTRDHNGDRWARICGYRFCGWSAAEFLVDLPAAPADSQPQQSARPEAVTEPEVAPQPSPEAPPDPEEGLGTLD